MEPITRSEQYLASIIGEDVVLPVPQSRIEHYLNLIAQNGISPSSAGLISYDPDADYPDGSLGAGMKAEAAEVNDLKSAIGENGANILSAYPTDTASGAIASFSDGAALPVKALTVDIEPVQSGSGDPAPDNVRPISGWTQAKVTRTGKNLLDCSGAITSTAADVTFTNNNDGTWTLNGTASAFAGKAISANRILDLKAGVTYKITGGVTNLVNAYLYKAGVGPFGLDTGLGATYTPAEDIDNVTFYLSMNGGKVADNLVVYPMLSISGTGTEWQPYTGTTVTIDLDGTRYGGTLDVLTGVLTVNMAMVDLGTVANYWAPEATVQTGKHRFSVKFSGAVPAPTPSTVPNAICSKYKLGTGNSTYLCETSFTILKGSNPNTRIYIYDPAYETATGVQFAAAMSGVQLVYELVTPLTVQLSANTLSTILGTNNIWADTGDVSVTYRADTTLYIDKLTGSTEEDMIADAPIASGKYFLVGNRLFLSTASIAAGAKLNPGTNCTETNLAAALNALNS